MDEKKPVELDVQTTVNEDTLDELIEDGEVENVYDSDNEACEQ